MVTQYIYIQVCQRLNPTVPGRNSKHIGDRAMMPLANEREKKSICLVTLVFARARSKQYEVLGDACACEFRPRFCASDFAHTATPARMHRCLADAGVN
ncbi:hypothetical protein Mapa_005169 [Marchantia paleacea]|nr:hypothetical protein Mapa_005169 [Marchantia paleacea]